MNRRPLLSPGKNPEPTSLHLNDEIEFYGPIAIFGDPYEPRSTDRTIWSILCCFRTQRFHFLPLIAFADCPMDIGNPSITICNKGCGLQRQPKVTSDGKRLATTANLIEAVTKIADSANGLTERQADAIVFKREDKRQCVRGYYSYPEHPRRNSNI